MSFIQGRYVSSEDYDIYVLCFVENTCTNLSENEYHHFTRITCQLCMLERVRHRIKACLQYSNTFSYHVCHTDNAEAPNRDFIMLITQ